MNSFRAFVTLALVGACAAPDWQAAAHPRSVRFDLTPARLVVAPVEVNGSRPRRFIIDTGATTTTLDERFASTLALAATGRIRIVTPDSAFTAPTALVEELAVGATQVRDVRVSWMPLHALRSEDDRISGVIGQDVLSRLTVAIDYRKRLLQLGRSPCPAGGAVARVDRVDGRAAIAARLENAAGRRDVRLVIDSAANALLLFEPSGRRRQTGLVKVTTHGGEVTASLTPRARVVIGSVAVDGAGVSIPVAEARIEDGLLPASWFSNVCVDGPRATAVVTP